MGQYNTGVLTTAGQQLITQALAGDGVISFPAAKTSSWAIPAGTNIQALTDLQDIQQTVTPGTAQIFNGTMIQVQALFSNANQGSEVTETYLVQTVGLWAQITGGEPTLFSVYQATTPDQMPAYAGKAPISLIYTLQATVQQASQLTVQVNPAGAATALDIQNLQTQITQIENDYIPKTQIGAASGVAGLGSNSAVPIAQGGTGGTTVTQALANLGAQAGFNLLVNSRFKYNGRNQQSYTGGGWTVDGWYANTGANNFITLKNGISIINSASIYQPIYNYFGETITFSVGDSDGNVYFVTATLPQTPQNTNTPISSVETPWGTVSVWNSSTFSNFTVDINPTSSVTLTAAKLERGSVSTLAADLAQGQDEAVEQLRLDLYDLDPGRPAYILTQNENLLDNWYFVGGGSQQDGGQFPINQRRQTSYSGQGYTVDKWRLLGSGMSANLQSNALSITYTPSSSSREFNQPIDLARLQSGQYTFSILTSDKKLYTVSGQINPDADSVNLYTVLPDGSQIGARKVSASWNYISFRWLAPEAGGSITILATKLELGLRSTLARLVDGEWVLNDPPPNFQQELAKCQRYLFDPFMGFNGYADLTDAGFAYTQTECVFSVFFPENMRVFPSLIGNDFSMFRISSTINGVFNNQIPVTNIIIQNWASNRVLLYVTTSQSLDIGATCGLWVQQDSGSPPPILFSAEL